MLVCNCSKFGENYGFHINFCSFRRVSYLWKRLYTKVICDKKTE